MRHLDCVISTADAARDADGENLCFGYSVLCRSDPVRSESVHLLSTLSLVKGNATKQRWGKWGGVRGRHDQHQYRMMKNARRTESERQHTASSACVYGRSNDLTSPNGKHKSLSSFPSLSSAAVAAGGFVRACANVRRCAPMLTLLLFLLYFLFAARLSAPSHPSPPWRAWLRSRTQRGAYCGRHFHRRYGLQYGPFVDGAIAVPDMQHNI